MAKKHSVFSRKLRMGMVGGGPGSFIGEVHRKAARLDGKIDIVAGAFSSDARKSAQTGAELCIDPARAYPSWKAMIEGELARPEEERIDFVSIVTPNHVHFPVAKGFLEAGFHVVCDKPMTLTVAEAKKLVQTVKKTGRVFALTHNYTGYPMVKLARDIIKKGKLGTLMKIVVQYPQGWLIRPLEREGAKQAEWRTDPKRSGAAGCMGDIGTHAENLAEYITGLRMVEVCADLTTFVKGRRLDDDGNCLVRWEQGVKGILFASQISVGKENGLAIEVHGEKGSLAWRQEYPNDLQVFPLDKPMELWRRGNDYIGQMSKAAAAATRIPFGHPEAFLEAFANVYVNAAETMRAAIAGTKPDALALDFPTVEDGLRGMQFIEAVVKSGKANAKWTKLAK